MDSSMWTITTTGKVKRQRKKFHIPAKNKQPLENEIISETVTLLPLTPPKENVFAGLNIDFGIVKKSLVPDDGQSIKSYKSLKSEYGKSGVLSKKEKIKLRRELLLKKIDTVNQMKKDLKLRQKRKNTAIMGDTNPLHDALPSLESLLKKRSDIKSKNTRLIKKKAVEKNSQRKRKLVEGVKMFKHTLKNKYFKKNPFEAISNHIKTVVEQERRNKP